MERGSLRVVTIGQQRWVVRAVVRVSEKRDLEIAALRFFNGAVSRYASDYPVDWSALPESELSTIFERSEPRA